MATNNLTEHLTATADAIRYKEGGGTTKINPQDFANRIRNLPSGGDLVSETISIKISTGEAYNFTLSALNGSYTFEALAYDCQGELELVFGNTTAYIMEFRFYAPDAAPENHLAIVCNPKTDTIEFYHTTSFNSQKYEDLGEYYSGRLSLFTRIFWEGVSSDDFELRGEYIHV